MVSNTQQTRRIRTRHRKTSGRKRKRLETRLGTPSFPVHPPGYDANAADAKPSTTSTAAVKGDKS